MSMPKVPWDLAVFLTVTTVGFGYSVQRVVQRDVTSIRLPIEADSVGELQNASVHSSFDLGCLEQRAANGKFNAEQGAIRLRGKFCQLTRAQMRSFEGLRVKNLSTGEEGTIFFHGFDASFVTDSVALQPGRNLIQLEWRARDSALRTFTAEVTKEN